MEVYAFFGVVVLAFLAGAFFLLAAFFSAAWGAVDLVTRPDLVLPRTTGAFSSTAGACDDVSNRGGRT